MMSNFGTFPPEYIGNSGVGAGFAGLLPALVNCIILAINGDPEETGQSEYTHKLLKNGIHRSRAIQHV